MMKKILAVTALLILSTASMASVRGIKADPYSDTTKNFVVSHVVDYYRSMDTPVSDELTGNVVSCQYDTIIDQYRGTVTDEQMVNGLVGIAAYHRGKTSQVKDNFLTRNDYDTTMASCAYRYKYTIKQEIDGQR